jgi:hypothetical protein
MHHANREHKSTGVREERKQKIISSPLRSRALRIRHLAITQCSPGRLDHSPIESQ